MNMTVCMCSDPECRAKGCKQGYGQQVMPMYAPNLPVPRPMTVPFSVPLTADEVRRIVREELERAKDKP